MSNPAMRKWEEQIRKDAEVFANNIEGNLRGPMKLRAAELLSDSAILTARTIAGENTATAQLALEASFANLSREAQAVVIREGRDLALRVAWSILSLLLKA